MTITAHRHRYLAPLLMACVFINHGALGQQGYQPEEQTPPAVCVSEQVTYHSNLFHLNNNVADVEQRLGPGASRSDTVLQTSACANADWHLGQQELALNLALDDNRFRNNQMLNHTSGLGKLQWDWRSSDDWYGTLAGGYRRTLGSFLNDRPIDKDLVDAYQYSGQINHDLGAFLTLTVGGARTDTSHSATTRQIDNYRSNSGNAAVTFTSLAENYVGMNFQRTRADYPADVLIQVPTVSGIDLIALDRDYREDITSLRFRYGLAGKTVLRGSAGYLRRTYPGAQDNNYSGKVWRLGVNWKPTSGTELDASAWQELTAYFDAQADHFVSRGINFTPAWTPRDKFKLSALLSWQRQQYLTRSLIVLESAPRKDKVLVAGIDALYQPLEFLDFNLRYSHEQHDSNLDGYDYIDRVSSLRIRARF